MTNLQRLANASILSTVFALLSTVFATLLISACHQDAPTPLLALLAGITALSLYCTVMLPIAFLWDTEG